MNSKISLLEILSLILAMNTKSVLLTINPNLHILAKKENKSEELCLRQCGYWVSLQGMASTTNTTNVTNNIFILKNPQQFHLDQLHH